MGLNRLAETLQSLDKLKHSENSIISLSDLATMLAYGFQGINGANELAGVKMQAGITGGMIYDFINQGAEKVLPREFYELEEKDINNYLKEIESKGLVFSQNEIFFMEGDVCRYVKDYKSGRSDFMPEEVFTSFMLYCIRITDKGRQTKKIKEGAELWELIKQLRKARD